MNKGDRLNIGLRSRGETMNRSELCRSCKYYSFDSRLPCAVNTSGPTNNLCSDWEEGDLNNTEALAKENISWDDAEPDLDASTKDFAEAFARNLIRNSSFDVFRISLSPNDQGEVQVTVYMESLLGDVQIKISPSC